MTETQAAANARAAEAAAGKAGTSDQEPPTAARGTGPGASPGAASGGSPGSGPGNSPSLAKPEDRPSDGSRSGARPAGPGAPAPSSAPPAPAPPRSDFGRPVGTTPASAGPPGTGPIAPPVAGPAFFPPPPAGAAPGSPAPTSGPPRPVSGSAAGRAVVGRAVVGEATGSAPAFTRAPGMAPPPDVLVPSQGGDSVGTQALPTGVGAAGRPVGASARGAASVGARPPGTEHDRETTGPITGAARVTEAVRAARATVAGAASSRTGAGGTRRARLHIKRVDPWSMMKFSFAVSLVLFFVAVVATSVLYLALDAMGVFDEVNKALAELVGNAGGTAGDGFKITAKGVVGGSALLGAVNVVLFTALATLGAFIYNVCADLVGGIELTLAEKD
jgi:hypothetical protein